MKLVNKARAGILSGGRRVFQRLPYPVTMRIHHRWWNLRHGSRYREHVLASGLPQLDPGLLQARKTSDTIFILGSGSSINRISDARWDAIRKHDSFGFNFWLIHPHVPTYYAIEETWSEIFVRKAAERGADYQDVPKLVTSLYPESLARFWDRIPEDFRAHTRTAPIVTGWSRSEEEFGKLAAYLDQRGFFGGSRWDVLFKTRATLVMLIGLALKLGYKRLILCGIDLNDSAYFYEDSERFPDVGDFRSSPKAKVHTTAERRVNSVAADQIVFLLNEVVAYRHGAEILCENPTSALVPRIPHASDALMRKLAS